MIPGQKKKKKKKKKTVHHIFVRERSTTWIDLHPPVCVQLGTSDSTKVGSGVGGWFYIQSYYVVF